MTGFRYPYKLVRAATEMYLASDKRHLPTMEEVLQRDRQWDIEIMRFARMVEDAKPQPQTVRK